MNERIQQISGSTKISSKRWKLTFGTNIYKQRCSNVKTFPCTIELQRFTFKHLNNELCRQINIQFCGALYIVHLKSYSMKTSSLSFLLLFFRKIRIYYTLVSEKHSIESVRIKASFLFYHLGYALKHSKPFNAAKVQLNEKKIPELKSVFVSF